MENILTFCIGYFSGTLTAFGIVLWQLTKVKYPKWSDNSKSKHVER